MLLDIFVTIPSLLMANIARVGLVLICLIVLFAVAVSLICTIRADRRPAAGRPEPLPQP
jgi:hypothetical protein